MKLVPLFDKVVLKQLVAEETTASGIVLPGAAKEKPQQAEVIAVGPGSVVDGKEVTMQVKAGDKVIYSKYSGTEVELRERKIRDRKAKRHFSCCRSKEKMPEAFFATQTQRSGVRVSRIVGINTK